MGGSEDCDAVLGDCWSVCDYWSVPGDARWDSMNGNSNRELVKNLLKAAVGILFAIILVMFLATFIMDHTW